MIGSRSAVCVAGAFPFLRDEVGFDLAFEAPSGSVTEFSRLLRGFLAVVRFVVVGLDAGGVAGLVVLARVDLVLV